MKDAKTCPICGKVYTEHSAISRGDNKTEICPDCGQLQAIQNFIVNCFLKSGGDNNDAKCGE